MEALFCNCLFLNSDFCLTTFLTILIFVIFFNTNTSSYTGHLKFKSIMRLICHFLSSRHLGHQMSQDRGWCISILCFACKHTHCAWISQFSPSWVITEDRSEQLVCFSWLGQSPGSPVASWFVIVYTQHLPLLLSQWEKTSKKPHEYMWSLTLCHKKNISAWLSLQWPCGVTRPSVKYSFWRSFYVTSQSVCS